MTCRQLNDFLIDYHSGGLSPDERRAFESHLTACRCCVEYLRSYDDTVRLARYAHAHPNDPEPLEVPEVLVRAILAARVSCVHTH